MTNLNISVTNSVKYPPPPPHSFEILWGESVYPAGGTMNSGSSKSQNARKHEPFSVSLVVPVFNEATSVELFVDTVCAVFEHEIAMSLEIIFINDGSEDNTLETLVELQNERKFIKVIDLSRNFGKEAALSAGLTYASGDVVVPIDVDLQDPPELIPEMIQKWREGYDVVLGRRVNRDSDTFLKRLTANWFYRIHNKISDLHLPQNVGDFRLMDRQVVEALKQLPESQRFMKGIFAFAGFKTTCVDYVRSERAIGATKFNGWKLWNLALEGITGFSTIPLRIWTYLGLFISFASFFFGFYIIFSVLINGRDIPGYASLMVSIMFLGGLQLMGIGILGEYLGRTYIESKRRPVFIVRRIYDEVKNEH